MRLKVMRAMKCFARENEMQNNARGFMDFLLTIRARLRRLSHLAVTALLARR